MKIYLHHQHQNLFAFKISVTFLLFFNMSHFFTFSFLILSTGDFILMQCVRRGDFLGKFFVSYDVFVRFLTSFEQNTNYLNF